MKKSLIAMGVAAVVAAPSVMAEATVYGQVEAWLENSSRSAGDYDANDNDPKGSGGGTSGVDIKQNNRLGFQGTEDLPSGLSAIYKSEFQIVSEDDGSDASTDDVQLRDQYVGISGNFGSVLIGRMNVPTVSTEAHVDIMQGQEGGYVAGPQREDGALAYVSPKINGLQATIATLKDGSGSGTGANQQGIVNAVLSYENGPLNLMVGAHDQENDALTSTHVGGGYEMGNIKLGLKYIKYDDAHSIDTSGATASTGDDYTMENGQTLNSTNIAGINSAISYDNAVSLAASYTLGNNVFKVVHSRTEVESGDNADLHDSLNDESTQTVVEVEHKLSNRTSGYALWSSKEGIAANGMDDEELTQVGLIHKF